MQQVKLTSTSHLMNTSCWMLQCTQWISKLEKNVIANYQLRLVNYNYNYTVTILHQTWVDYIHANYNLITITFEFPNYNYKQLQLGQLQLNYKIQLQLLFVACKNRYRIHNTWFFALLPAGTGTFLNETKHYSSVSSANVNFTLHLMNTSCSML